MNSPSIAIIAGPIRYAQLLSLSFATKLSINCMSVIRSAAAYCVVGLRYKL